MYSDSRPPRRDEAADTFRPGDIALGFYVHLLVYVVTAFVLARLEPYTGWPWRPAWPLIGWGVGLVLHALGAFVLPRLRRAWRAARRRRAQENYRI